MASEFRHFHRGERTLQAEAGVDSVAFDAMVAGAFRPELQDNEARFVAERTFSVAASVDDRGRPWASPLLGHPRQLFTVEDPVTITVRSKAIDGDPLLDNVAATAELGILYIDLSRRRRAKSLGRATVGADGTISYRMHRNFGLCNKYIFKRSHEIDDDAASPATGGSAPRLADRLDAQDRAVLEKSDTVFLASHHVDHGADATHRGGPAGFVTVVDAATIELPDYVGNGMFQTLGNLLLDDHIGLLALDFATGRAVQLTGRGSIVAADPDDAYAVRVLRITIDEVRSTRSDIGLWTDIEAFPIEPGLRNPGTPYLPGR